MMPSDGSIIVAYSSENRCRIDYGSGYRVYCAEVRGLVILLLCGGNKTTQASDILRAKQFWTDYKQRENGNK